MYKNLIGIDILQTISVPEPTNQQISYLQQKLDVQIQEHATETNIK